jgi:hypothetical protein
VKNRSVQGVEVWAGRTKVQRGRSFTNLVLLGYSKNGDNENCLDLGYILKV